MQQNTWLTNWLERWGLSTPDQVIKALARTQTWDSLIEYAHRQDEAPEVPELSRKSVVAGRSLDLTGFLACGHPECVSRQVDQLFSHVWHYFDQIVVVGPDSHLFLEKVGGSISREDLARKIAGDAQVLFHVNQSGLNDLLVFTNKPPSCPVHWPGFAEIPDLQMEDSKRNLLASQILSEGRVTLDSRDRYGPSLVLHHADIALGSMGEPIKRLRRRQGIGDSLELTLAKAVIAKHHLAAASDLFAAESLGLPLGANVRFEARVMAAIRPVPPTLEQIAFQLRLPVVDGLSTKELLALRDDERDAFDAFRGSLRSAINERIRAADASDSEAVAAEIEQDVIEPALADIQRRLAAAETLLKKKQKVNVAVMGLSTVCGLIGQPELAAAAYVGAGGSAVNADFKYMEETRDTSLHDMYFLWAAKQHAAKHSKSRVRK